jgi:hypothetical protein
MLGEKSPVTGASTGINSIAGMDEKKFAWMKPYIERLVIMFKSNDIQQWLQVFLIDPVLQYMINKFFAYFLIALVCFGAILIFVILTFILLIMRTKQGPGGAALCVNCGK